ncbi:MAG: polysaccharide biosynthesis/export family protein [Verrucomicrobiaceae bacterium]|nr:polysaccharide biosynthesis/export family protein [Verrucomicrobiaceae bacterium]
MKSLLICILAAATAFGGTETTLKPGERVSIAIGGITDSDAAQICRVYTISDDGTINLLHIKRVKAAGLKPSALQAAIERAYVEQEYYQNPTVTVSIDDKDPLRQVFVVSGCVNNGPVAYTPGLTLLNAVSASKGFSPFAQKHRTTIIRSGKQIRIDLSDPANDLKLEPGDQILIKE